LRAAADLERMGLTLKLTTGDKLVVKGLSLLSAEQQEHALAVAKKHKPAILEELRQRETTRQHHEWVAIACYCRFDNCTMLGDRKPMECRWSGEAQ